MSNFIKTKSSLKNDRCEARALLQRRALLLGSETSTLIDATQEEDYQRQKCLVNFFHN